MAQPNEIPEIRTKSGPDLEVPEIFARLVHIAYNLWWCWSPQAHRLFALIDRGRWMHYRNPVEVLINVDRDRWEALAGDDDFTRSYHLLVEQFDAYTTPRQPTWYQRHHEGSVPGPIAYLTTEFGWHECLQIYSGGLGVLSGDHCKSASDLGLPFVGVGLMYRHGYFRQEIDAEGFQQHFYPDYEVAHLPLLPVVDRVGHELYVAIDLPGRKVFLRVWKAMVGRVPVLLLDSDLPVNHPADRPITSVLYVRGREMRLCQELVLGLGGARVLGALGIEPAVWHMNEGHSALSLLERLGAAMQGGRASLDEALARIAARTIFTTHTPVPAGNEAFDDGLIHKYLTDWCGRNGIAIERLLELGRGTNPHDGQFNLTGLALRASARTNAVSELHGRTANDMWRPLIEAIGRRPIEHITNGVHPPTWIGPEIAELIERATGTTDLESAISEGFAAAIEKIPGHELWAAHMAQKRRLVGLVRLRALVQEARHGHSPDELRQIDQLLDSRALIIGFARRFATYKRADLILRDVERLKRLLGNPERPVQFIFAGKAHPADRPGQDLIRRICQSALDAALAKRIVFVENYDMGVARGLVQGVDVWLNTPRRPQEASGTSGMKAAMNGALNASILDGWWCEGYDAQHGWAIGSHDVLGDAERQDQSDADALYALLEQEIVPCYYERDDQGLPVAWIERMKRALAQLTPRFSSERMVREYADRYYVPAGRGDLEVGR